MLVLGVGGILGEAWMWGYLGGAERATGEDFRQAKQLIGTSAGSIVAARLAGGEDPRRGEDRVHWDGEVEPERRPTVLAEGFSQGARRGPAV
jgi:predicted acylesterase/phospholipase RssA